MLVSSQGMPTGVSFGDNRMSGKQGWRRRFAQSDGDEERKMRGCSKWPSTELGMKLGLWI